MALTAAERETIYRQSDDDKFWYFNISRRADITKTLANPSAVITEDYVFEGTRFISGTIPKNGLTQRNIKVKDSAPKKTTKRVVNAAKCSGKKADGTKCTRIARKDTGRCPAHPKK